MTFLYSLTLLTTTAITIFTSAQVQTSPVKPTNIETKTAIVVSDTTEGNYFEFLDGSGGWWLETDGEHPTFEVGQVMKFTIDNCGTTDLEDDKLLVIESLGFIE